MRVHQDGFTYIEVLVSASLLAGVAGSLTMGLIHGMRLSEMTRARTELLNAAQGQMEQVRGTRFAYLQSYDVDLAEITGTVTVNTRTARQKQVSVRLAHAQLNNQPIELVTHVHREGLNDGLNP